MLALSLLSALLALAAVCCCLRRAHHAEARATAATAQAASLARCLGLLADEIQSAGLSLLGPAARAGEAGAALAGEVRGLLRLADETQEMLAASAGPRRLNEEHVDLAPLLAELRAEIAAQLGPARRQWRLAPDFAGMTLRADRRALRGALVQVMTRAARLTREADWIDLRPVVTAESLAIVVEDEGAGLGAADLTAEAPAAEPRTRGLSFGLAVARSLLEAHGGDLRLEAQPGVGVRAWLILPRARLMAG